MFFCNPSNPEINGLILPLNIHVKAMTEKNNKRQYTHRIHFNIFKGLFKIEMKFWFENNIKNPNHQRQQNNHYW